MNSRRKEMLSWAVKNLVIWPHDVYNPPEPSEINCQWERNEEESTLPVLVCCSYGWQVNSTDFFYGKKGRKQ